MSAQLRIELLTPEDVPAVQALFARAMSDPFKEAFRLVWRCIAPPLCIASVGISAALRQAGFKYPAVIGALPVLPALGWFGLRALIQKEGGNYIAASLEQDMKDPIAYYVCSNSGEPPRTAFWVAKLAADTPSGGDLSASDKSDLLRLDDGDRVIGCVALDSAGRTPVTKEEAEMKQKHPPKENWAELRRMCVDSSVRRMGIARALHAVLRKFAEAKGFEGVTLTTSTAQPEGRELYKKMGYTETRVEHVPIPILGQAVGVHTFELKLQKPELSCGCGDKWQRQK